MIYALCIVTVHWVAAPKRRGCLGSMRGTPRERPQEVKNLFLFLNDHLRSKSQLNEA